jgi:hypothetical protein
LAFLSAQLKSRVTQVHRIAQHGKDPEIEAGLRAALGHGDFKLTKHDKEARKRFGVTVKSGKPIDLAVLAAG